MSTTNSHPSPAPRLTGWEAIAYATAHHFATLHKYADPTEDARDGLTVTEAGTVAQIDPSLIWCERGYLVPSQAAGRTPGSLTARTISVILSQKGLADSAGAFYDHATALSVGRAIAPTLARQLADMTTERDERGETVRDQAKKIDEQAARIERLEAALTLTVPCLKIAEDGLRGWGLIPSADACVHALAEVRAALAGEAGGK